MEWFQGTVEEASEEARLAQSIYIVFINNNDEESERLLGYLATPRINKLFANNLINALRINTETAEFQQFVEIYKTVPIPSIFFIDHMGQPVGLVTSDISSTEAFQQKVERIIQSNCLRTILRSASQHCDFQKDRAYVTEVSSSSEDMHDEAVAVRKVTQILNHVPIDEKQQLRNLNEQIAMNRYEFEQHKHFLEGGEDVSDNNPMTSHYHYPTGKLEKEFKGKISKQSHPPLTNLLFEFEDGETRIQYFNYKTSFGTVRCYLSEVLKHHNGVLEFYVSTTYPNRILVPELDKATLEELGLYPTAQLHVHVINDGRQNRERALLPRKTLFQSLGGLKTIIGVTLWTLLHPVMVATNWLGFKHYLLADDDDEYEGLSWNLPWNIFNLNHILNN